MPVWLLLLLGLSALGFALWWLDNRTELDATERFGRALAILFVLGALAAVVLGFLNADWR
jgi:hypothetical protein